MENHRWRARRRRREKAVMENHHHPAKRRREKSVAAGATEEEEDRISQLPGPILDHIISFLSQEEAVRTCTLSKSWRHLGPTRPKIEFHQSPFPEREKKFLSVVENTLQRYHDQNLSVQEFVFGMRAPDFICNKSCWLLNKWIVRLQMLKRLSLHCVYIEDEILEKIMSTSCPLIQHLVLDSCTGLSSVKVNKARNLKHLVCYFMMKNVSIGINDDAPSRLKSLYLMNVHVPAELQNNLSSNNCPCLQDLKLHCCSGFTEFKLSNRSIKRLIIDISNHPINAVNIDAPNMLYFEFTSDFVPSISFATTWGEWKSRIKVLGSSQVYHVSSSTWYQKLHEFLKALSLSQISLDISSPPLTDQGTLGDSCEPLVIQHLCLRAYYSYDDLAVLLNCVFRICRPRYIGLPLSADSQKIWKHLEKKGETRQWECWQQDLEESSIQVSDKNANEWHPAQVCKFSNNEKIRFRLKWREI